VIAVDQDRDGRQGTRVWKNGDQEVWARPLAGGARAVAFFNRAAQEAKVSVRWAEVGVNEKARLRDLWLHRDVEWQGPEYSVTIPAHGVVMLRVGR